MFCVLCSVFNVQCSGSGKPEVCDLGCLREKRNEFRSTVVKRRLLNKVAWEALESSSSGLQPNALPSKLPSRFLSVQKLVFSVQVCVSRSLTTLSWPKSRHEKSLRLGLRRRLFHLIHSRAHQRQQRISIPKSKPRLSAIRFRAIMFRLMNKVDIEVQIPCSNLRWMSLRLASSFGSQAKFSITNR